MCKLLTRPGGPVVLPLFWFRTDLFVLCHCVVVVERVGLSTNVCECAVLSLSEPLG